MPSILPTPKAVRAALAHLPVGDGYADLYVTVYSDAPTAARYAQVPIPAERSYEVDDVRWTSNVVLSLT